MHLSYPRPVPCLGFFCLFVFLMLLLFILSPSGSSGGEYASVADGPRATTYFVYWYGRWHSLSTILTTFMCSFHLFLIYINVFIWYLSFLKFFFTILLCRTIKLISIDLGHSLELLCIFHIITQFIFSLMESWVNSNSLLF